MFSILQYIRNGEVFLAVIAILSRCFVVFCCLPIHEFAHGLVADKLGDDTARRQGRLTINPFAHLDLIGTLMIFLIGIGYANPVPVNPRRFKHPRRDMAIVALAGPLSNLILAFIWGFCACAVVRFGGSGTVTYAFYYFFYYASSVNVSLAVFNLFPIPPLDGSKVLASVLPERIYYKYMKYERYIMIVLMLALLLGLLSTPISVVSNFVMKIILYIPSLIFGVSIY